MSGPLEPPFAVLAAADCPPYDEMLVGLEREFRAVDREAVAAALDDAARPLFALVSAPPEERVVGLARGAWEALPDEGGDPPHWLLARALDERRASGAVRAAVAVELARRAGIEARPARMRGCWAVLVPGDGVEVAADVGADGSRQGPTGDLCVHRLAFAVLSGLAGAWRATGDLSRARRASGLRLLLPLGDRLRALVREEVRALGRSA